MLPGIAVMMFQSDLVSGLSVVASPSSVSKTISSSDGASHSVTSPPSTATASGGTGPYTYAWTFLDGDAGITINSPAAAATSFTATLGPDGFKSADFRVTATDTVTRGTAFFDIDVTLENVDLR